MNKQELVEQIKQYFINLKNNNNKYIIFRRIELLDIKLNKILDTLNSNNIYLINLSFILLNSNYDRMKYSDQFFENLIKSLISYILKSDECYTILKEIFI